MTTDSEHQRHTIIGKPTLYYRTDSTADGPDRITVFPAAAEESRQTTKWISLDVDCVVSLADMQ